MPNQLNNLLRSANNLDMDRVIKDLDDKARNGDDNDPALLAFLRFLDDQMAKHPEWIVEADESQLKRIANLVGIGGEMNRQELVKLRKSIIGGVIEIVRDELLPDARGAVYDCWYDYDNDGKWEGPEVIETRQKVFDYVENALQVLITSDFCRGKDGN